KICAGINHALVQPLFVEIIANVVVMMDVLPRTAIRVAAHHVQQGSKPRPRIRLTLPVRYRRTDFIETRLKITVDLDQALAVTLAKADGRRTQELEDSPSRAKFDAGY